jgi:hypothetical protein
MDIEKNEADISEIKRHLARIDKALNSSWRSFVRGTFQGLGSIIGATIVIVFIGWVLNIVGVIPEFKGYVDEFKTMVQDIRNVR